MLAKLCAPVALMLAATASHGQETIKIGGIFALSGPASFLGVPEERGFRMKIDEINKAGGLNGRKIEAVVYDTEGNTTKAAQQFRSGRIAMVARIDSMVEVLG